jgi:hypothetical protein
MVISKPPHNNMHKKWRGYLRWKVFSINLPQQRTVKPLLTRHVLYPNVTFQRHLKYVTFSKDLDLSRCKFGQGSKFKSLEKLAKDIYAIRKFGVCNSKKILPGTCRVKIKKRLSKLFQVVLSWTALCHVIQIRECRVFLPCLMIGLTIVFIPNSKTRVRKVLGGIACHCRNHTSDV